MKRIMFKKDTFLKDSNDYELKVKIKDYLMM